LLVYVYFCSKQAVGKLRVEALVGGAEWKKKTTRNVAGQNVDLLVTTPGLLLKMRGVKHIFVCLFFVFERFNHSLAVNDFVFIFKVLFRQTKQKKKGCLRLM
jgi:hypothetical protein